MLKKGIKQTYRRASLLHCFHINYYIIDKLKVLQEENKQKKKKQMKKIALETRKLKGDPYATGTGLMSNTGEAAFVKVKFFQPQKSKNSKVESNLLNVVISQMQLRDQYMGT